MINFIKNYDLEQMCLDQALYLWYMNKNGFLSIFLVLSLFLPVVLSFVETVEGTVFAYKPCQENQSEEQESEEQENNNELEAFVLDELFVPFYTNSNAFEIAAKKSWYINVNREILTPPPQLG